MAASSLRVSERIAELSDDNLLKSIGTLRASERRITLEVVLHLVEVERRNLHIQAGFDSLFAYCRAELGYCESAATRRIRGV